MEFYSFSYSSLESFFISTIHCYVESFQPVAASCVMTPGARWTAVGFCMNVEVSYWFCFKWLKMIDFCKCSCMILVALLWRIAVFLVFFTNEYVCHINGLWFTPGSPRHWDWHLFLHPALFGFSFSPDCRHLSCISRLHYYLHLWCISFFPYKYKARTWGWYSFTIVQSVRFPVQLFSCTEDANQVDLISPLCVFLKKRSLAASLLHWLGRHFSTGPGALLVFPLYIPVALIRQYLLLWFKI